MAGEIQLNGVTLATESSGVASIDSSVNIKGPLNASGSAPIYACRAWVNFDGFSGTSPFTIANGGIRASGNVSSITDNGVGKYTVNFTIAMPDANYVVFLGSADSSTSNQAQNIGNSNRQEDTKTTSFIINTTNFSDVFQDKNFIFASIFR